MGNLIEERENSCDWCRRRRRAAKLVWPCADLFGCPKIYRCYFRVVI